MVNEKSPHIISDDVRAKSGNIFIFGKGRPADQIGTDRVAAALAVWAAGIVGRRGARLAPVRPTLASCRVVSGRTAPVGGLWPSAA